MLLYFLLCTSCSFDLFTFCPNPLELMAKNPYTLPLAQQVFGIPSQMLHYISQSRYGGNPEELRFGNKWRQYLLFWPNANPKIIRKSVVVFYHGGAWRIGAPALFPTVASFFLQAGFPVIMPAYRLAPWFSHPHMREDLDLAMQCILPLLEKHGLGERQLIIGGHSAGATLAAHLAFDVPALQALGLSPDRISGYLSIAGPLDLDQMPRFNAVRQYAGDKPGSQAFYEANPIHHLSGTEKIPALFIHGKLDAIVPIESAASFYQHYAGPSTWIEMPNGTHLGSLRFTTTDTETGASILDWLSDK
jgi:acetyl esterase/lipase